MKNSTTAPAITIQSLLNQMHVMADPTYNEEGEPNVTMGQFNDFTLFLGEEHCPENPAMFSSMLHIKFAQEYRELYTFLFPVYQYKEN